MNKTIKKFVATVLSSTMLFTTTASTLSASAATIKPEEAVLTEGEHLLFYPPEYGTEVGTRVYRVNGEIGYCIDPYRTGTQGTFGSGSMYEVTDKDLIKALTYSYDGDINSYHFNEKVFSGKSMKEVFKTAKETYQIGGDREWYTDEWKLYYLMSHAVVSYFNPDRYDDWDTSFTLDLRNAVDYIADEVKKAPYPEEADYYNYYIVRTGKNPNSDTGVEYQRFIVKATKYSSLKLNKVSAVPELLNIAGGDGVKNYANFNNAVYGVYKQSNEQLVAKAKLKADGSIQSVLYAGNSEWETSNFVKLHYGDYYLKELETPNGYYELNTEKVKFTVASNDVIEMKTHSLTVKENPKIKLTLYKDSANPEISDNNDCYSLANAIYAVYNNEAAAYNKDSDAIVGYIKTGENGYANAVSTDSVNWDTSTNGFMTVGYKDSYYAREIKAPKGYLLSDEVIKFEYTENKTNGGFAVYTAACEDVPDNDPVRILIKKRNAITGETKGLEGAEFTINYYDGYYTAERHLEGRKPTRTWVIKTDEDGYALLDDEYLVSGDEFYLMFNIPTLPYGTISVQETKAPAGYEINPEIFIRQIKRDSVTESFTFEEIVVDEQPSGKDLQILKVDEDGNPVVDAVLQIRDEKGKVLDEWKTNGKAHNISGLVVVGGTYVLHEVSAPQGHTVAEDQKFTVSVADTVIKLTMVDKTTDVAIKKVDENGNSVEGAVLQVIDSNGSVVYSFTSGKEAEDVTGFLNYGETYMLREKTAPAGYIKAEDVEFTVNSTDVNNPTLVTMVNKKTETIITKTDVTGEKEISGASLEVRDGEDKLIDSWVSTDEAHIIRGLEIGKTYKLTETLAPNGYFVTTSVQFTVNENGVTKVVMKNEQTTTKLLKVDENGNPLANAGLKVVDKDGKVIDEWVSTTAAHEIKGLTVGETYTLIETFAPNGYVVTTAVQFTVSESGLTEVSMKNKQTTTKLLKVDEQGNPLANAGLKVVDKDGKVIDEWVSTAEAHEIKGLTVGETYTLVETFAPKGYVIGKPVSFVVSENGITEVKMNNKKTVTFISKKDITGENELTGATLKVVDTDGNMIDTWVSTEEAHVITGLEVGKTYKLIETISPAGYTISNDVEFTVKEDGVTFVEMKDDTTKYEFIKVDDKGTPVKDAVLQIIDKDGKIIDEWTTDGKSHEVIGKLVVGETYILHEKSAPEGYELAEDITFKVENKSEMCTITMVDIYDGDVTVSTPDQPTNNNTTSDSSSVLTGQSVMNTVFFALLAAAAFIVFSASKKRKSI